MSVFDKKFGFYGKDHPYKLWLELIDQLHNTLYKVITNTQLSHDEVRKRIVNPTSVDILSNALDVIINALSNITEILPEVTFRKSVHRNGIYVEFEGELVGSIHLNNNDKSIYIKGHHYLSKTSRTGSPIMLNSEIEFKKFIEQVIDPDDLVLKTEFEKIIFKLS